MSARPGIAVDAHGGSVIDPTANVIALNDASHKRQDDLRELFDRLVMSEIHRVEQVSEIRAGHLTVIQNLHQAHDREIHRAEQDRLNSIRQIDVSAVKTEADRNLAAIQTLAQQTAVNAETLRTALVNTATTIANTTAQTVSALSERIAALEKSSYEGAGKQAVADPMMEQLVREVKALGTSTERSVGKGAGIGLAWVILLGAVALVSGILGIAGMLYAVLKP